jgi:hypothetical protein
VLPSYMLKLADVKNHSSVRRYMRAWQHEYGRGLHVDIREQPIDRFHSRDRWPQWGGETIRNI